MTAAASPYVCTSSIVDSVRAVWRAPPRLLISEFADKHLVVTSGPLATTRWNCSYMPYQTGILDAFFEPGIEIVVLQASSQVGKTSAAVVIVAYHIVHDPCPILVVEPTVNPMARDFSKNRLEPVIAASPILAELVSKKRASHSNTCSRSTRALRQHDGSWRICPSLLRRSPSCPPTMQSSRVIRRFDWSNPRHRSNRWKTCPSRRYPDFDAHDVETLCSITDVDGGSCSSDQTCGGGGDDGGQNEKGPRCSDGIDNDGDGLIDCDDPDCSKKC